ncbi:MAG: hypothetical protein MUE81_15210 [Thermoflexibacter sp.]|jgi:hypothetical protein|nr:hypothetical protein [Thermoflexibacter sp.]
MIKRLCFFLLITSDTLQAQLIDFQKIDFRRADSIAAHYKGENLKNLPFLAYKLTSPLSSEVEQFRAIYTWVSTNIESDYDYFLQNKNKRQKLNGDKQALDAWNSSFQSKVFKKLLKEQKTVCTGYAYLVKELATLAGINCKIIDGYGRTVGSNIGGKGIPNHSWNAVYLNNQWYLCDATWSSGYFIVPDNQFIADYNDGYFLANPALFAKNHYPLDTAWILMDTKPKLSEFLNAPLIYKHAFNYQIIPVEPQEMKIQTAKNESITFLFKITNSIVENDISIEIVAGEEKRTIKPDIIRNSMGFLEMKCRFERLGNYDVHIRITDRNIATYTVQVKKNK